MSTLTTEEVSLLIDALDVLEAKEKSGNSMTETMANILVPKSVERDQFLREQKADMELMRERIILLKAKLIQMKDKAFVDELD